MSNAEIDFKKLEKAADRLSAIAHPLRIAIISFLDDNNELNVTDICAKLKVAQATVSHHLSIMKDKGIVISRKEAQQVFYSLHVDNILKTLEFIDKGSY